MNNKITTPYLQKLIKEEISRINVSSKLLKETLYLKDFGPDGNVDKQPVFSGVSGADIAGTGIKKGDFLVVRAIMRGGKPMGRYRKYDTEEALAYKTENKMPSIPGINSIGVQQASMMKPGSWWYSEPDDAFTRSVSSVSGEGFLLTAKQMAEIGISMNPEVLQSVEAAEMEQMQESKVTTSYLKKLIQEEINKMK